MRIFLLLTALILITSCTEGKRDKLPVPPAGLLEDRAEIDRGAELFAAHCAECHGSIAEGRTQRAARFRPQAPDFHELRYRDSIPGYIYLRIEQGRHLEPFNSAGSVMPAWGPYLDAEQIWSLVAYLRYRARP